MDEFGVDYLPGYPESAHYINSNLMIVHGDKVVSNNSTTKKYLDNERISVIYGHIHRNELAYRTYRTDQGPRTIMAASPGCLCRVDGAVPSTKSGMDEFGRPLLQGAENWQQGLGIVTYQPYGQGNEWFNYEPMWIYEYSGEYETYTPEDLYRDMEGLRKAGIIEVTGIAEDGQWLYSMTEEGKGLYEEMKKGDLEALLRIFERIAEIEDEEND
jgi:hypothetical protein